MKYSPLKTLCAFVVATALILVSAWASAANTTPGVTAHSIRIGLFGPLTGSYAVGSLPLLGAEAIYKNVNAHGGIHGRKIQFITEDSACNPNKAIAATKKLISQEHVFMIHGGWCSGAVMAIKPELARHPNLPFMVLGAANAAISTPVRHNIFHPVATTATVAKSMLDFALSKPGAKRIAIISHSTEWAKSQLDPILKQLKQKGMAPATVQYLERGQVNATSQVLHIKASKPDFVIAILYPAELTIYLRDAYKYGIKAPTVTTQGASLEDMVKRVSIPAATRNLFVFYPLSHTLSSPKFKKWEAIYKKYNPGQPVETLSFMGMTGALAIVKALREAGPDLTQAKFINELNKLRNFDPGLQSGPLTFTPKEHAGISSGKMIHLGADGKPEIVTQYPTSK